MFRDRIREHYDDLTPGFTRVADFLLDNTLEVAFLTATELAKRADVDPATVVRFCQEIEYSGFRELSKEIKQFVYDQISSSRRMSQAADSYEAIAQDTYDLARVNLKRFTSTELPNFAEAAEIIGEADCIWITGEFVSEDLASFLVGCFDLVRIPARKIGTDAGSMAVNVAQMSKSDVLLALSSIDPGTQTRDVIRLANGEGIPTVAITASNVSPPAREADVNITVPIQTADGVPRFSMLLMVMGLMWEVLAYHNLERTRARLADFGKELRITLDIP
jgi:DNA-binding MurR/RpiR family transcriptional regulator